MRVLALYALVSLAPLVACVGYSTAQEYGTSKRMTEDLPVKEMERRLEIPPFVAVLLEAKPDGSARTSLEQNLPNPVSWRMKTEISFQNGVRGPAKLRVMDLAGREIARLYDHLDVPPGRYRVAWLGVDSTGTYVPPGLYLYELTAPDTSLARSLLVTPSLSIMQEGESEGVAAPSGTSPEALEVLESLMAAFRQRDVDLYGSLLAEDFRRILVPQALSWKREEEIEGITDLFRSHRVAEVLFQPVYASVVDTIPKVPRTMAVRISGGELLIRSQGDKELRIPLGRQELLLQAQMEDGMPSVRWQIIEWRQYGP